MDRFIGTSSIASNISLNDLKSNMDRFIVIILIILNPTYVNLKSNMDRFIEDRKTIQIAIIVI